MNVAEIRRLAISGGLVAAAFAVKYTTIGLPNVEPLTLAFFGVGYAYGSLWGAFVGAVGEGIFATVNPMGAPIAPVWVAQIIGMALAGVTGGITGRAVRYRRLAPQVPGSDRPLPPREAGEPPSLRFPPPPRPDRLGLVIVVSAGVLATILFDLLTNLAMAWSIGPFWVVMVAAVPFAGIHIVSNALLFALIFPILRRWLDRYTSLVADTSRHD